MRREVKINAAENCVLTNSNETAAPKQSSNDGAPQKIPPSQALTVRAAEISFQAGECAEAIVEITVADDYHINVIPPSNTLTRPNRKSKK